MPQISRSWRQTPSHLSDAAIFQQNGGQCVILVPILPIFLTRQLLSDQLWSFSCRISRIFFPNPCQRVPVFDWMWVRSVNSQEVIMFRCVNRSQSEYSSRLRHTDGEVIWSFRNISWMLQALNLDNISFQRPKIKHLSYLHPDKKDLGKFYLCHILVTALHSKVQRNCQRKWKIAINSLSLSRFLWWQFLSWSCTQSGSVSVHTLKRNLTCS